MIARLTGPLLVVAWLVAVAAGLLAFFTIIGVFGEGPAIATLLAVSIGTTAIWRWDAARP